MHNLDMFWRNTLKYPMLVVGVVLFAIFLNSPKTKEYWQNYSRKRIPSTCDSVKERISPKAPSGWKITCPTTQSLLIGIAHEAQKKVSRLELRTAMYKELANSYVKIGRLSNLETLSFLKEIRLKITHPHLSIISKTEGEAIVELTSKKTPESIAKHLKLTVKVKELLK